MPRIHSPSVIQTHPAPAPASPARRTTAELHRLLREAIVSTRLAPGSALSETRVGIEHGLSRTPVREVFRRLADEGLLQIVPQVGTFVAPIDLAAVRHNQFIREALECRMVELAAQRIDAAGREALRLSISAQQRAVAAGDVDAFFEADETMHCDIASIAGQPRAWHTIQSAKSSLDRVRRLSLVDLAWARKRLVEHRRIVAAITARRPADAVAAMRSHLDSVFAAIEQIRAGHDHYFIDTGSST